MSTTREKCFGRKKISQVFKTEKCIKTTSDNLYVDTVVVKWDTKEIVTKYKQRNVNLQDIAVNGSVTTDRVR